MALPKGLSTAVETPVRVTIISPLTGMPLVNRHTGEESWVELFSTDSAVVQKRQRQISLARINEAQMRNRRPKKLDEGDIIQATNDALDTLAALTHNWSLVSLDGEPITDYPCTPENARELYADPGMTWLKEFVDNEAGDRRNFAKGSSRISSNSPDTNSASVSPTSPE